jgi:FkbM family methyltransferase
MKYPTRKDNNYIMDNSFNIEFLNRKFTISVHEDLELLSDIIRQQKTYSHGDLMVFDQLVQAHDYVLDLGANIGWYSLFAAQIVKHGGKVFSFEPNEKNYKKLVSNIETNLLTTVVIPYQYAIWDENTEGNLKCSTTNFGDHILNPKIDMISHQESQKVTCVSIDSWLKTEQIDASRISLIKLDIQGSEIAAFDGMKKFFQHYRPAIVTEHSPLHFKALGYSPFDMLSFMDRYDYVPFYINGAHGLEKKQVLSHVNLQQFIEITNQLLNSDGAGIDLVLIERSQAQKFANEFCATEAQQSANL